jgi:ketosteroid isomerase-like protein
MQANAGFGAVFRGFCHSREIYMAFGKYVAALCMWAVAAVAMAAPADLAAQKQQVADTERAFAATMKARDHAAFTTFLAEDTVFFSGPVPLHGKHAVAEFWKKLYARPDAPFSWEPTEVEVLDSGMLAFSSGPVYDPAGKQVSKFSSIWQRDAKGQWKIVFDHGWDVCDCKKPAP